MRLDKFISQATDYSRKDVKVLIKKGSVSLDGCIVSNPAQHILPAQKVMLDNTLLTEPGLRYFMLNKPAGYVCATKDEEHPTVLDLLNEPNKGKLQIAGRLDIDTTGLVLITDDGSWNHAVTSPSKDCKKTYYVTTTENINSKAVTAFQRGIVLKNELKATKPAELFILYANEGRLTISEGKYHQVKRMFASLGNHVEALNREAIGSISLDPELAEGEYRPLTLQETNSAWAD